MTAISSAIQQGRKSRVSGYKILKGNFQDDTPNLPQVIAILGEANAANQPGLTTDAVEVTSAKQAGDLFGYGSPIHQVLRILRPLSGDGVAGIPTVVFPQLQVGGAVPATVELTVTAPATANAIHTVVIAGRENLDFESYSYSVSVGDDANTIAASIVDATNGALSCPVTAGAGGNVVTFTTKWNSATASEITSRIRIDTGNNTAGVTYAITNTTNGTGVADISDALTQFSDWYTVVINTYGTATLDILEQFNGVPDPDTPTGRYQGDVFEPFVALFGSVLDTVAALTAITDDPARVDQVTNVLCPAPRSEGFSWEAAANCGLLFSTIAQNTPHLDVNNKSYPDMPVPINNMIGEMSDYNNRDVLVKAGCSTVVLKQGSYVIQDFVTTYHPEGENPLQFAYPRNLNLDWNIKFGYDILESQNVRDAVLVNNNQVVEVGKSIKPVQWKGILFDYFDDLGSRGLITDPQFTKDSIEVEISTVNPDRIETSLRYKRTGISRIQSTDVTAGF